MPRLRENIDRTMYEKFIHEALKRSDMFLFVIRNDHAKARMERPGYIRNWGEKLPLSPKKQRVMKQWDEIERNMKQGKEIFYRECIPFVKKFAPYHLYTRRNEVWPSIGLQTAYVFDSLIEVCLYQVSPEVEPLLLQPEHLYSWNYPYYPEDICFFKDSRCWFCLTSHESDAFLYADSEKDVEFWKRIGMEFFDGFDEKWDVEKRWEEKGPDGEIWDPPNKPWK